MYETLLSQAKILEGLGGIWIIGLLVFSRNIAFTSTGPLIGNKSIPALIKISFAVLLTLIMLPNIEAPSEYPRGFKFIYLIAINVLTGLLIGWVTSLVIEIVKVAGEMTDMQMALNAGVIFDPGSQTQTTIVGKFFDYLALTIFVSMGGIEKVIEGLYKSFTTFPVVMYHLNINFDKLVRGSQEVLSIGFLIVSPIIVILLIQDLILGIMSRAAPQINAFQISFSIKPSTGFLILLALLPPLFEILSSLFNNPMKYF